MTENEQGETTMGMGLLPFAGVGVVGRAAERGLRGADGEA